jgi:hypothetical protein
MIQNLRTKLLKTIDINYLSNILKYQRHRLELNQSL